METNKTENLSTKVVKGGSWLFLFQILDNVLGFIRLLILARLLTPTDFGLAGIAMVLLQTITTFTQTGVQALLVHKKDSLKYFDTAWTYLLLRGVVLYIALFIAAPFLSSFFNAPEALLIIRIVGLTLLFEGFTNIGIVFFQKNLTFHKQFVLQIAANFVDFVVAITIALVFRNAWAIVAGYVTSGATRMILSYLLSKYRPRLELNIQKIREMTKYGKWIFGSSILTFLYSQADDIFVGKMLGTTSLGYYQLAYRISNLPATQISYLISTVMFPAYSLIQSQKEKLATVYLSTIQVTAFLSFFMGIGIILLARDFVVLFLGDRWIAAAGALQILTIWGILRSIGATAGALWQASGTPQNTTKIQLFQTILLGVFIYPLTILLGITGTALSIVLAAGIANIGTLWLASKTISQPIIKILQELFYPLIACLFTYAIYELSKEYLFPDRSFISFFALAIVIISTYLSVSIILSKLFFYRIFKTVFSLVEQVPYLNKYTSYISFLKRTIT